MHVRENCDGNNILTLLDQQAGDWSITNTQRIYQTAEQLLSSNHVNRPRIVEVGLCHSHSGAIQGPRPGKPRGYSVMEFPGPPSQAGLISKLQLKLYPK